ncbi:MAG TPA: oligopeptidase B, partial [Propionibacteriaceae bacterium]
MSDLAVPASPDQPSASSTAPVADRRPQPRVHHGDEFVDPYEWLRDKEDPDVLAYLTAENAHTQDRTAHLAELRRSIFDEIKARTQETDLSVPVYASHPQAPEGEPAAYWYYDRTVEGSEYSLSCRVAAAPAVDGVRPPPDTSGEIAGEQVLLDGNVEAEGHAFFSTGAMSVSPDGTLLAYSVDTRGDERFQLRIRDLRTGEELPDVIEDTAYGVAWAGRTHLFYTRSDDAWRPYVVRRHRLGTDPDVDVDVLREPDERFWVGVDASRDDAWILLGIGSKLTSEVLLLSTADPEGEPRVVAPRRQGVEYEVEPAGDRLLIVHNDGAEDFELAEAPLDSTSSADWTPVIPHQLGVRIVGVEAYARHAVVSLRRAGLTGLHVLPR